MDTKQAARELALARAAESAVAEELQTKQRQFEQETLDVRSRLDALRTARKSAEETLRQCAIADYLVTGNKQQPGVTIRIVRRFAWDAKRALEWAMEHRLCLKLDEKAFEATAKATPLDFVTLTEEPTAAIDSDLAGWLALFAPRAWQTRPARQRHGL